MTDNPQVWQPGGRQEPGQVAYIQGLVLGCRRPGLSGRGPKGEVGVPMLLPLAIKENRREGVRRGHAGGEGGMVRMRDEGQGTRDKGQACL